MPFSQGGSGGSGGSGTLDGWVADGNAPTFASASSFTAGSSDLTATYQTGTLIKFTQTTVKFFVVTSSSFGAGTTTVNVMVNTDYTIANAAITAPFYSYQANPQGFPTGFNFTPGTITGWAASPTVNKAICSVVGRQCFLNVNITGTSNATTLSFTVPITASTQPGGSAQELQAAVATDNTVSLTTPARVLIASASSTVTCGKDFAGAAWTNTGTKTIQVSGAYSF